MKGSLCPPGETHADAREQEARYRVLYVDCVSRMRRGFIKGSGTCLVADDGEELPVFEVGVRSHCEGGQWRFQGVVDGRGVGGLMKLWRPAISLVAFQVVDGWPRVGAAEAGVLWSEVLPEAQIAPMGAFCCAWLGYL